MAISVYWVIINKAVFQGIMQNYLFPSAYCTSPGAKLFVAVLRGNPRSVIVEWRAPLQDYIMPKSSLVSLGAAGEQNVELSRALCCRMFWPRDVWGRHASSLEDFKAPEHAPAAVACLNELVTDALRSSSFPHASTFVTTLYCSVLPCTPARQSVEDRAT